MTEPKNISIEKTKSLEAVAFAGDDAEDGGGRDSLCYIIITN